MNNTFTNINIIDKLKNDTEDNIISFLKNNKNFNINIKDTNNNYFLQHVIIKNYIKLFSFIINNNNLELDIIDNDNRSITYYVIRFNRIEILKILIQNINKFIGFPFFNIKDNQGFFSLSYTIIFNNFEMFKLLYNTNKIDIFKKNSKGESLLHLAIKYKNNNIIDFLLEKNFPINLLTNNSESILHYFLNFNNTYKKITDYINLLDLDIKENNFGLTPLHLMSINQPQLLNKINNIYDYFNLVDFYGNTILFYLIIEKHFNIFENFIKQYSSQIDFNILNINGDTILHLYISQQKYNLEILKIITQNTNLSLQNNQGITPLHILIKNNINIDFIKDKPINIFILDNKGKNVIDYTDNKKQLFTSVSKILNEFLLKNKDYAKLEWEIKCLKKNNCLEKIFKYLIEEKKNPPFTKIDSRKIFLDNNVPIKQCQYAGITLDILFGILFLKQNKINVLLDFPLTINDKLTNFFKTIGIDLSFKIDFINIQIYWAYQKLFLPSFLDSQKDFNNIKKNKGFTIIPIGIEIEQGGHANILIIDHNNKIIERFEPNGANPPSDFNYNPNLLDKLLQEKFNILGYKYLKPDDYLPAIGLQYLEALEINSCQIGDPNGFCAVWCIWWAYHKSFNYKITSKELINKLIHKIKVNNISFKNIIRNFSYKITNLRDKYLKEIGLDINLWIQGKYNDKNINQLIKNINT